MLGLHKRIVGRCRLALAPDLLRQVRKPAQERVAVRQQLILQPSGCIRRSHSAIGSPTIAFTTGCIMVR